MPSNEDRLPYNQPNLPTRIDDQIDEYRIARETYWQSRNDGADWDESEGLRGYADKLAQTLLTVTECLAGSPALQR